MPLQKAYKCWWHAFPAELTQKRHHLSSLYTVTDTVLVSLDTLKYPQISWIPSNCILLIPTLIVNVKLKSNNPLFSEWTAIEKSHLGISNLFAKYFLHESYDAHRALGDVDAMVKLFTAIPLISLLSDMTIRNVQQMCNIRMVWEHAGL